MRVLVTGAGGFVGRWLARELEEAGHEVVATGRGELDVTDRRAAQQALADARPDAIAHLAAVAFGPRAAEDPTGAMRVTVGGTVALFEAIRISRSRPAVLVTGTSDVYGRPDRLPVDEDAPLAPASPYALTKVAQEAVARAAACRDGLSVVVTRSFNHSGPGQRPPYVIPALAERFRAAAEGRAKTVPVGNLDVRRDFTDVRDVVVAYRLLLEAAAGGGLGHGGLVVNVASGRSIAIREIAESFRRLSDVDAELVVDPDLARPAETPELRGDADLLSRLTGWAPRRSTEEMLRDVWEAGGAG